MKVLYLLTDLINTIFIKSLYISVLSIIFVGRVLKTDTRNAFTIIKWLIGVYAGLNISYYFIAYLLPDTISVWGRATGPYTFAYYLMLIPNTLLPLLLLFKKLGRNKYMLLILSVLMNIGWVFELFIMYSTDIQRDQVIARSSFNYLWFIVLNGAFIGSVIYAVGRAFKRKMPDIDAPTS